MSTKAKLSDRVVVTPAGNWVPMALYRQFMGVGVLEDADAAETVTVQLRKATDGAGANATSHGTAIVKTADGANQDLVATATAYAAELGKHVSGAEFTHVSAQVTDSGDTENAYGVVVRADGRYTQ